MNKPEDNFGRDLVNVSAQLLKLAKVAQQNGGFTDLGQARAILPELKTIADETLALMEKRATQEDFDELTMRMKLLMGRLLSAVKPEVSLQ